MRYQGTITTWKDEEGYGFITPRGGGPQVFMHMNALAKAGNRPSGNEQVTYEIGAGKDGRPRAERVEYVGSRPGRLQLTWMRSPSVCAAITFFVAIALFAGNTSVPLGVPVYYLGMSMIAWLMYGFDKRQAESRGWRISENSLHLIALLGGWPGALVAQQQFRHKNRKRSFLMFFWVLAALNVAALVAFERIAG